MFHFFLWLPTAGLKHGPVRSRRYRVHAYPFRSQLFRQRFGKHRETGFGLRIIEQDRAGFIRLHRGGIDDCAPGLEMGQRGAGDPERRVDIGFKGGVKVFGGELLERLAVLLTNAQCRSYPRSTSGKNKVAVRRMAAAPYLAYENKCICRVGPMRIAPSGNLAMW